MSDPQAPLRDFEPGHNFFVGIDSDGCVFDTMEIKHKECFIPNIINYWGLQAISRYAREAGEFVNLYSKHRGINRWPALLLVFDLLAERPEVQRRNARLPEVPTLRAWAATEKRLANPALKEAAESTGDPVLKHALAWSEAVNKTIAEMVRNVPPFPFVRESLEALSKQADIICVSQTPGEALQREWEEHDLARYAAVIAGQEMGSKTEHLRLGAGAKYPKDHCLMIGDAPGDLQAARANDFLFYPVEPGNEYECWQRFHQEAVSKFFDGTYAGDYEAKLVEQFQALLPDTPPWKC